MQTCAPHIPLKKRKKKKILVEKVEISAFEKHQDHKVVKTNSDKVKSNDTKTARAGLTLKNYRDLKGVTQLQLIGMASPSSERSGGVVYISKVFAAWDPVLFGHPEDLTPLLVKCLKQDLFSSKEIGRAHV